MKLYITALGKNRAHLQFLGLFSWLSSMSTEPLKGCDEQKIEIFSRAQVITSRAHLITITCACDNFTSALHVITITRARDNYHLRTCMIVNTCLTWKFYVRT